MDLIEKHALQVRVTFAQLHFGLVQKFGLQFGALILKGSLYRDGRLWTVRTMQTSQSSSKPQWLWDKAKVYQGVLVECEEAC